MIGSGQPLVTQTQGALQVAAVSLFAAGMFLGNEALQLAGFVVFAFLSLVAALVGVLTPGGVFVSLVILGVGALVLSPWWLGYAWYSFVLGVVGLPKSIRQVVAPEAMLRREGRMQR